jgi:glycosyltransferase involved in cell wall biosynthesis
MSAPRIRLVHDYVTQRGGADRVVLAMAQAFPGARLHTSIYRPEDTYPEFQDCLVDTLWLDRVGPLHRDHRKAFPLLAAGFGGLHIDDADVVICSSSGWAHGVRTRAPKVVYCYSPARWLYQPARYAAGLRWQQALLAGMGPGLRRWDRRAAHSADRYLTSSTAVQRHIQEVYGVLAEVVPPPVLVDPDAEHDAVPGLEPGFFVCVSRLLAYKNVDVVIRAFGRRPDLRLVVVGDGPLLAKYQAEAPANVTMLGAVSESQLRWLYRSSVANVSASYEDYGLTPIEALVFGKPSITLRYGGFLDTILEGDTGIYFDRPHEDDVLDALDEFAHARFCPTVLADHLTHFSRERFLSRLEAVIADVT